LVSDKKDIWPVKNLCQLFAEVLSCWRPWRLLSLAADSTTITVYGTLQANIDRLQRVQHVLVQAVAEAPWTTGSTNIYCDLHWSLVC